MNRLMLPALLLFATGCHTFTGHVWDFDGDPSISDHCDLLGGVVVVNGQVSCEALRQNIDLARDMLIGANIVWDDAQFNEWFGNTKITIYANTLCLDNGEGTCTYADTIMRSHTYPERGADYLDIRLDFYGDALLHEMIHGAQLRQNQPTVDHPHWHELGYYALADQYFANCWSVVPGIK